MRESAPRQPPAPGSGTALPTRPRPDAALLHGSAEDALVLTAQLAAQPGPIVTLTALPPGATEVPLARLVTERSVSTNTAAAGGNASLMTLEI